MGVGLPNNQARKLVQVTACTWLVSLSFGVPERAWSQVSSLGTCLAFTQTPVSQTRAPQRLPAHQLSDPSQILQASTNPSFYRVLGQALTRVLQLGDCFATKHGP